MTPSIKVVYFDSTGRAELTRLCLAYGKIKFDDNRIDFETLKSLKPTLPLGQLPIIEVDNVAYPQSIAMARYAASIAGISPSDPLDALKVDCVLETVRELFDSFVDILYLEKDEAKKEEKKKALSQEKLPKRIEYIEKVRVGKYLLGDKISLADLAIFDFFSNGYKNLGLPDVPFSTSLAEHVKAEPGIAAYLNRNA